MSRYLVRDPTQTLAFCFSSWFSPRLLNEGVRTCDSTHVGTRGMVLVSPYDGRTHPNTGRTPIHLKGRIPIVSTLLRFCFQPCVDRIACAALLVWHPPNHSGHCHKPSFQRAYISEMFPHDLASPLTMRHVQDHHPNRSFGLPPRISVGSLNIGRRIWFSACNPIIRWVGMS